MKNEKETRENLLKSAKKEFLEKGFMQASLRNICKNAGVTTGALYFFFEDKEDLFANLVQEPLSQLTQLMGSHYADESEISVLELSTLDDFGEGIDVAKQVIHFMYHYYDEFQLILTKSQGSRFENCVDYFVDVSEKHYRIMADKIAESMGAKTLDDYMIHWVAHMQIDAFVHLLTHEASEEKAVKQIESIVYYIISGWMAMFQRKR
ncbi:MAG: TetR/AcrR family transcriptional regulator [Lachnospiraceae bacterium]|nr:TetR/AcrR family transcriptional regulator [Lachnospiraceae bacterium]